MFALSLLLLAAAPPSQAAAAESTPIRQPAKRWVLDYAETNCTALRAYDTPAGELVVALRPSPSGEVMRLMIVRQRVTPETYHFPVEVSTDIHKAKATGLRFSGGKGREVVWINLNRAAWRRLQGAAVLGVKGRLIDERLAVPGIGKVISGLDACNDDLRKHWNVENAGGVPIAEKAKPVGAPERWLTSADYPGQSLGEGKEGRVGFVMMVDETGAPKDCMVDETSGNASLDAQGCVLLLKRAKFKPALDAAGKPVRSVYSSGIRWVVGS